MVTATSSGTAVVTLPADNQIQIVQEFAAPKHLVYKAVTTPELIKRWWNAKRGEVTVAEVDLRVSGKWRSVMAEYPSREIRDTVIETGMEAGMQDAYDLLEELAVSLLQR